MRASSLVLSAAFALAGCEEPPKKNPFDPPPNQTVKPPPVASVEKPKGPPEFRVGNEEVKVGFSTVLVDKPDGRQRLETAIDEVREHVDGKTVSILAGRKAKLSWMTLMMDVLAKKGAAKFEVKTETRKEFPAKLEFTPQGKVDKPPPCSVVAMVLEDRGTAVWQLSGGTASKRAKGFAGPDLTMTGETIERKAAGCKTSDAFFVSADDVIEWGLTYDLAASTQTLDPEKAKLGTIVLLQETPVAGHAVKL